MNISCEVIKDLLPLYHDGVCSNDSKMMVEEHLLNCDDCKAELQSMDGILLLDNIEQNLNEAEAVKKISKEWRKGRIKSIIEGILITAIIVLIFYCFMDIKVAM